MNPRAEAGHPSGRVFRYATGAHHSSVETAIPVARCAAIITIVLALLTGCRTSSGAPTASASCGGSSGAPTVAFQPDLLPIEISLALDGTIEVSFSPELVTPLGTFSVGVPIACVPIASSWTLLEISRLMHNVVSLRPQRGGEGADEQLVRHEVGGGEVAAAGDMNEVTVIKIKENVKMTFFVDGPATLTPEGNNVVMLSLGSGVTGIRIQGNQSNGPTRFWKTQVSTLPTPQNMTAPPAPPPASFPEPQVSCKPGDAGIVACVASLSNVTGSFNYQWFDNFSGTLKAIEPSTNASCTRFINGTRVGPSGSAFCTVLPPGVHHITATATSSNDSFKTAFTSSASKVPIQGGQASAPASAS